VIELFSGDKDAEFVSGHADYEGAVMEAERVMAMSELNSPNCYWSNYDE